MTQSHNHVREYLADIGRRGGEKSRRDLFPSHAKKMVAIREMKRAAIKAGKPWPPRDRKTLKLLKLT
jgi:hypothetical protein